MLPVARRKMLRGLCAARRRQLSSGQSPGSYLLRELFAVAGIVSGIGICAGGAAFAYEQYNLQNDPHGPGMLVNIGSKMLHVVASEAKTDTGVTIVFEGGSGETTSDWVKVQRKLAGQATCICYDRAGLGFSEAGQTAPSAESINEDLVQLLTKLKVQGPVVLVAHGAGALYARQFATACTDPSNPCYDRFRVGGLVLLDPQCEGVKGLHASMHSTVEKAIEFMEQSNSYMAVLSSLGFGRWAVGNQQAQQLELYPQDRVQMMRAEKGTAKHRRAMQDEIRVTAEVEERLASRKGEHSASSLPPTTVLARGRKNMFDGLRGANVHPKIIERMEVVWEEAQREIVAAAPRGKFIVVEDADMYMAQKHPDTIARIISEAVAEMDR